MKLMIWGGNLALTGGDIFAFPDWKEEWGNMDSHLY